MGASTSSLRDGKSPDDATTAEEQNVFPLESHGRDNVDSKLLQKNGKISGLNGKADDQIDGFDGRSGEKVQAEVGQTDSVLVSQKEDILEVIEVLQDEVTTPAAEKESLKMNSLSLAEEKANKEDPDDACEVGFKKIFRFVGFKFTLKKDKTEKPAPVQLTANKEEADETSGSEIPAKIPHELDGRDRASEPATEIVATEGVDKDTPEQNGNQTENTEEITPEAEPPTSPIVQETQSPIRRFFTRGVFSSLRKRTSFKKPAEEALLKENEVEKEFDKGNAEWTKEEGKNITKEEAPYAQEQEHITTPEESKVGPPAEIMLAAEEKKNEGEIEAKAHSPQTASEGYASTLSADTGINMKATEQESEDTVNDCTEKVITMLTTEVDLLSCRENVRSHGSPLKKLFTGAGLKKRSKKLKEMRVAETKLSKSAAEQLQSSAESAESTRIDSSFSSPEDSTEYVNSDPLQSKAEGDGFTSDEERKKDGIQPWSSFKKLMTPKKRAKISSESEDEAAEKAKAVTLSSMDNSVFTEQQEEQKCSEELKTEFSTEEPPRKKESSMSWEALLCRGSGKKRARKTSDSDWEKVEEDEESGRMVGSPIGRSQNEEHEFSSPEQAGSPSEGDGGSTWASLKRLVTPRRRAKSVDRTEDSAVFSTEQVPTDNEMLKEETSFSLKRLMPGRRKKGLDGKREQISYDEAGNDFESAEEDSDTPAVVPLSEFDLTEPGQIGVTPKEEIIEKQMETTKPEITKQVLFIPEPAVTLPNEILPTEVEQTQHTFKAGMPEQPATWILTNAELETEDKTDCTTKYQQLSDIPEEGAIEDTVSPKSTAEDDTITEDIELTSEAVTAPEQVSEESFAEESTEMVSAVSRLTDSPGTSGEATPVAAEHETDETKSALQETVESISLSADIVTTSKEGEKVLVTHTISETTVSDHLYTICIGSDSQEIQPVKENMVTKSAEVIPIVSEVLSAEIVSEDKTDKFEVLGIAHDGVYEAQIEMLKAEFQEKVAEAIPHDVDLKVEQINPVENVSTKNVLHKTSKVMQLKDEESVSDQQVLRTVQESMVNLKQVLVEDLDEQAVIEDKPKFEEEEPGCQSVQVIEASIVKGEKEQGPGRADKTETNVKYCPVADVIHCLREEFSDCMSEPPTAEAVEEQETLINVESTLIRLAVAEEATSIVNPPITSNQSEIRDITNEVAMERVSFIKCMENHEIKVLLEDTEFHLAESTIVAEIEAASTNICMVAEDLCEAVEEEQEVMTAEQVSAMATSEDSVTVQEIIENVNIPEKAMESEAAESHKEEGKYTSILEDSTPASNLTEEAQMVKEPEAVSVIANAVEKVPDDISREIPSDASIQVKVHSPTGKEADNEPLTVTETYESPIPEVYQFDEGVPMERVESPKNIAQHYDEGQESINEGADPEKLGIEERRGDIGENLGNQSESKTKSVAVEDDQNQVDCEGYSQRERDAVIEHDYNPLCPRDTQDKEVFPSFVKEYVMVKQEDVKDVSLNVIVPHVSSQMEDAEDFLSLTGVAEEMQFEDVADSMTQVATESNKEGGKIFTKCLISQEVEGDIAKKPMEDSEKTTVTTTLEVLSEIVKEEDAQSQEGSSGEVISKAVECSSIREVVIKKEATEKSQPQTSGDGETEALMISKMISKMEPKSTELTAAS